VGSRPHTSRLGAWARLAVTFPVIVAACSGANGSPERGTDAPPVDGQLFTMMPSSYTGIEFANRLSESGHLNVFTYRNYYNGGGVALGDLTGDGLPEVMLTANRDGGRLYLNLGELRFRDVTDEAGVGGRSSWTTGVTFADVNGDGRLDIYLCHAGTESGAARANQLFLHQGVDGEGTPIFRESATEWGVADEGYSTHAAFFDYDRDGDLDLYVVNNSPRPASSFGMRNLREVRHPLGGDRLYRNDGDHYTDASEEAGIFGSEIAFGLGVAVGDVSGDGWPDIYVSNDFFERDYLYVNRRDGTFEERIEGQMPTLSYSSMGLDVADIDNDGRLDVFVLDMLPEDETRLKTMTVFESWDEYQMRLKRGYHHQLTRNTLQLNNGDGSYSEIGELAGVARTDWSWSALIADFDLDGYKDLYVTNGMPRDLTSQDYLGYLASDRALATAMREKRVDFGRLVEGMESTPLPNYAFRNNGDLTFSSAGAAWGLELWGSSNGAAYGDLDGDGAPDLVVNNLNGEAAVYRNNARALSRNRWLGVRLDGTGRNRFAIGARVALHAGERRFVQELMPSRGFQSSVDYVLSFGVGAVDVLDSVRVSWPDGRVSVARAVAANQRVRLRQADAREPATTPPPAAATLFTERSDVEGLGVEHRENGFVDFQREPLMPKLVSTEGPALAVGDVNGDGLDDLYLGGAKEQPGTLLIQRADGGFVARNQALFEQDAISEDVGALFLDADGDGAPDLYVVSGGSEFSDMAPALVDRLYLNDGTGQLRKAEDALPRRSISGSRVAAADFDGDGDLDLFVGGRVVPWRYGLAPPSALLVNDGSGRFEDRTREVAPELERIGMVTDALWQDLDADGRPELVVVGEWMPIAIFHSEAGHLVRLEVPGLEKSHGWWNRIVAGDFTGDGRTDFIAGNLGRNTRLSAAPDEPLTMHVGDLDGNGFIEQIVSVYRDGASVPLAQREDLLRALPSLRSRLPDYASYAGRPTAEVFTRDQLSDMVLKQAYTLESVLVRNNGDGSFSLDPLPVRAQLAPVYGLLAEDFDADGALDVLLAGNFDGVKPELGRMAAGRGVLLRGDGAGGLAAVPASESGFRVSGAVRGIVRVRTASGVLYVLARNDDRPAVFQSNRLARVALRGRGSAAR
jgi:hypothetical protein